ncbi:MAG: glycosyltransferase family 4 protein [Alphaproteobacteria bacterium]|nr:glycosyltransferase family 4 protein [Alphaproteobacteria bacterium]
MTLRITTVVGARPQFIKAAKRFSLLPLKFIYFLISNMMFFLAGFFVFLPFKKRAIKYNANSVLMISHVAISFDGRIKKSANQLMNIGKKVTLIRPFDSIEDPSQEFSGLNHSIKVKKLGLGGMFNYFPCIFDPLILFNMIFSKDKYLHCHDINTAFMGIVAAKITGKTIIADLHEWKSACVLPQTKNFSPLQKKVFVWAEKMVIKHADVLITVGQIIEQKMLQAHNIQRQMHIVENRPPYEGLEPYSLREKLNIDPKVLVGYYIGQMAPYRNIAQIIEALAHVKDFVIVFQGPINEDYLLSLQALGKKLNVNHRLFFLPPIPHDFIPSACQGADVGIFTCLSSVPSMHSTMPNKLFEYVLGELPIISENNLEMIDYLEKYDIGTLVDSTKVESLVRAFESYLDSKKLERQKKNVLKLKKKFINNRDAEKVYKEIYS